MGKIKPLKHHYCQRWWRTGGEEALGTPQGSSEEHGQHGQKGKRKTEENGAVKIVGEKEGEVVHKWANYLVRKYIIFLSPDISSPPCFGFLLKRHFFRSAFPDHLLKTTTLITPYHLSLSTVVKHRFYYYSDRVRPTDQMIVVEPQLVICCFQEEGACHAMQGHMGKHQGQSGLI